MITEAASHNGLTKKFIFGSEWFFHPEGIKYLMQRFERELDSKRLVCPLCLIIFKFDIKDVRIALKIGGKPCRASTSTVHITPGSGIAKFSNSLSLNLKLTVVVLPLLQMAITIWVIVWYWSYHNNLRIIRS
jgi:hypothetical protein